jgi:hypothetical protein
MAERRLDSIDYRVVQRVPLLGPVERDARDAALDSVKN